MAYDNYHSPNDPLQPHYPSSYDANYDQRDQRDQRSYQPATHPYAEQPKPPSPPSSRTRPDGSNQPLNDALSNAFDKSDAARGVDPDLIAEITAQVKKSVLDDIKLNGVGVTGQPQPPPQPSTHYVPQSPSSASASIPSRNVYTPPSPLRHDYSSHGSLSPDPLAQDPMFDGNDDTPTPRHAQSAPINIPQEKVPDPRPAPHRAPTDGDATPLEKTWQPLFDPSGQPTPRLGQFLRGLALHLIEDYEPKKSLVIPPSKMLRFYEDVKLSDEIYPWSTIFGKVPYPTLSRIYREMRCQHHLIQEQLGEQPFIPALTPAGFQEWMTAMIQAYPATEYQRLSKAVLAMPISNADECKERFPKQLPQRLFPRHENLQAQQRCAAALGPEGVGPRRAPSFPPPPPMSQSSGPPPSGPPPSLERERSPYYGAQTDSRAIESDDEDDTPLSVPLERERKPYSAAPGGGKVHNDDMSNSIRSEPDMSNRHQYAQSATANINSESHMSTRHHRAQTAATQPQWVPPSKAGHPHRRSSHIPGRRTRSPSFSGYGTRSDPHVGDIPPHHYSTSNIYDTEAERKRMDWARRQPDAVDEAARAARRNTAGMGENSHTSQPRSIYDDDYYRSRDGSSGYGRY